MLVILFSYISCFECLFTCPGKRFPLTEKLFLYDIACKYSKKEHNKYSIFKNTKSVIK